MEPRLDRTLGALMGVHAGDSLGATLEFRSWEQIASEYPDGLHDIVGGGVFDWPAGHATDDTDLTRAVLLAYRDLKTSTQGQEAYTLEGIASAAANYSLQWLEGDWPDRKKGSQPRDIG